MKVFLLPLSILPLPHNPFHPRHRVKCEWKNKEELERQELRKIGKEKKEIIDCLKTMVYLHSEVKNCQKRNRGYLFKNC